MSAELDWNMVHPRYRLAQVVHWLWLAKGPAPFADQEPAVRQTAEAAQAVLTVVRKAHADLEQRFEDQRSVEAGASEVDRARLEAERALQAAAFTARPRFEAEAPAGQAWVAAQTALTDCRNAIQQAVERSLAFEQRALAQAPGLAGLLTRRFGSDDYSHHALGRWTDTRAAQRLGYSAFVERRQALHAAIAEAEQRAVEAEETLVRAEAEAEVVWEATGASFMDPEALADARRMHADANAHQQMFQQRRQHATFAAGAARKALTQAVGALHHLHGSALAAWARTLSQPALSPDPSLPLLDPVAFLVPAVHSDWDHRRRESLQRASLALVGPDEPLMRSVDQAPVWLVLAYGNAAGLPGTAQIQASMGGTAWDGMLSDLSHPGA